MASENVSSGEVKKPRLESPLIGTHSGTFHADEALAVSLLRSLEKFKSSRLVRTRDPAVLETCDIVVDVGGQYDPARHRYDHHQREFSETYSGDHRTKLSSAGLIYKHFGSEIVASHLGLPTDNPTVPILVAKLYDGFIEAIDAIDNGIERYETVDQDGKPTNLPVKLRYQSHTDLSSRISHLNPAWNEPVNNTILDSQFEKASSLAGSEFFSRLDYFSKAWLPGRELVVKALENRFTNQAQDKFGRVLIFDSFCPWKDHLHTLEKTTLTESSERPLYVLYADESQNWRIQAIPVTPGGFESRKALPEAWRGVRDAALSELIGIPGSIFVHASGFIGGNQTFEGALKMAQKALEA
ncbi:urease accessory protein [Puccinia graminis f. sp. tritici CRL 75-36-700-3]|uniref:Urease accessory protein n=1 Tax=Puccinia graminis f. sp. tritici (strain CRL 75-36-700-3 / race SCCL) TaxID=418459 RepID=E3JR32_PUCGT|nr:urease accessory protein [Puccinia graminis f. sp. tritici CRL 75-36-700-3]EFP74430.1 urease accessory protein [Puccinia graminis f. sp. tritici CRL 75-36-700-3]